MADKQHTLQFDVYDEFKILCEQYCQLNSENRRTGISTASSAKDVILEAINSLRLAFKAFINRIKKSTQLFMIDGVYPVSEILNHMSKYNEDQLVSLKKLSSINVEKQKELITNTLPVKLLSIAGAIYASITLAISSSKEIQNNLLNDLAILLQSDIVEVMQFSLLGGVVITLCIVALQYIFYLSPNLEMSRSLDSAIEIAIENSRHNVSKD